MTLPAFLIGAAAFVFLIALLVALALWLADRQADALIRKLDGGE